MQDDYRTYVSAVNKILHDYNKTKEKLDILTASKDYEGSQEKKKKEIDVVGFGFYTYQFPDQARIFSSDDLLQEEDKDSLLLVNRDADYLKESMLSHLKQSGNRSALSRVDLTDWCDYTHYALSLGRTQSKRRRVRSVPRKRNKKIASYRVPQRAPSKNKKHDISLSWPIDRSGFWLSSFFGSRKKPNGSWGFHYGLDMAAIRGTPVHAASPGIVVEARFSRGYGNTIVIAHNRKYRTRYAHLRKIVVKVGQKVIRRQLIGKVGRTGLVWKKRGVDPSHLHFEVYNFGKKVNPMPFLA